MAHNIKSVVGTRLKEFRGDHLTQRDFADLLRISPIGYQNYEYGKRIPPELLINRIATLFGTTPRALVHGETASDRSLLLLKLAELSRKGIGRIEDLYFLTGLIDRAYSLAPEQRVTAAWLVNYYTVFKILLAKTKNCDRIFHYFAKIFVIRTDVKNMKDLLDWLDISLLPQLLSSPKAQKQHGFCIARVVSILLLAGQFSLTDKDWQKLRERLQPWCFWVGRHALFADKYSIDTSVLIQDYEPPQREKIELQKTHVSATIYSALYRKVESLLLEERKFTAGITIKEGKRGFVTFAVSANTMNELISVVRALGKDSRFAREGNWEIRWEPEYDSIFVQKETVRVHLLKVQMEQFLTVVKEIADDPDIRRDLALAWAAEYGAI